MRLALRFLAITLLLFVFAVPAVSANDDFGFCAMPAAETPETGNREPDFTPVTPPSRNVTAMDDWGCRCTYTYTVCSPYVRCYTEMQCRLDVVCTPTDCTESQVCEPVHQCDVDWWCWSECGRYECYI